MKGTMSVSVDSDLISQFDEILQHEGVSRSVRVNEWVRDFVEKQKARPDEKYCAKHRKNYALSLPICPDCARELDAQALVDSKRAIEAQAKAQVEEEAKAKKELDDAYMACLMDEATKAGNPKYVSPDMKRLCRERIYGSVDSKSEDVK